MNKRREGALTDMKREWETSGRGGRAGEWNNSSFLVIRDKAKRGGRRQRSTRGVVRRLIGDEGSEEGEERFKLRS